MDLERFAELADRLAERLPPQLLAGLNGGIVVRAETRRNADDPPGIYILGEYITDPYLGAFVALYYGSFRALFSGRPEAEWEAELWSTIKHELRHHLEGLAGLRDLDIEDAQDLTEMHRDHRERRRLDRLQQLARRRRRRP